LRRGRIVTQSNGSSDCQGMLGWVELKIELVIGESECFAVEGKSGTAEDTEDTEGSFQVTRRRASH